MNFPEKYNFHTPATSPVAVPPSFSRQGAFLGRQNYDPDSFPVYALPEIIRNTVSAVQQQTQAPLALVAASALGAISLTCQGVINVARTETLVSPVALFMITLAESGERKSTVDKLFMTPLYQADAQLYERYEEEMVQWRRRVETHKEKMKALKAMLRKQITKGEDTADTEERIARQQAEEPPAPVRYKLIFSDVTPAALKKHLAENSPGTGIMSDEAGMVFKTRTLSELPFFNKLWDGATVTIDRKSAPDQVIKDGRLTMSLLVQPGIFANYLARHGDEAKSVGLLARTLICHPTSTQGSRMLTQTNQPNDSLRAFHQRQREILSTWTSGNNPHIRMMFSPEARQAWEMFFNNIEVQLAPHQLLSHIKDYASKVADNTARIAALFQYFAADNDVISAASMNGAIQVSIWYLNQFLKAFAPVDPLMEANQDACLLMSSILAFCSQPDALGVRKSTLINYGPEKLRKKTRKIDTLLQRLEQEGFITTENINSECYITLCWKTMP